MAHCVTQFTHSLTNYVFKKLSHCLKELSCQYKFSSIGVRMKSLYGRCFFCRGLLMSVCVCVVCVVCVWCVCVVCVWCVWVCGVCVCGVCV